MTARLADALRRAPVLAVLRGVTPEEAPAVGDALIEAGLTILEVTLDSPSPFESLRRLADRYGDRALIAAGTVLKADQAAAAAAAGAQMIVAPNFAPAVVAATRAAGVISCPGVMTPSEAFAALDAGADALKLFPGDALAPKAVKGLRAVLPKDARLIVTGGVDEANARDFIEAGADGVGVGSALFAPGRPPATIRDSAERFLAAARDGAS